MDRFSTGLQEQMKRDWSRYIAQVQQSGGINKPELVWRTRVELGEKLGYDRSSRMQHSTSCMAHQTLQLSFLPWILWMRNLQCTHSTISTALQFVLPLVMQSKHSTSTTSLQTTLKCTELPWVSVILRGIKVLKAACSFTSSTQT